jgi:hypothetical protein
MGQLQSILLVYVKQDESIEMPDKSDHIGMAECFTSDNEVNIREISIRSKLIAKEQVRIRSSNRDSIAKKRSSGQRQLKV